MSLDTLNANRVIRWDAPVVLTTKEDRERQRIGRLPDSGRELHSQSTSEVAIVEANAVFDRLTANNDRRKHI